MRRRLLAACAAFVGCGAVAACLSPGLTEASGTGYADAGDAGRDATGAVPDDGGGGADGATVEDAGAMRDSDGPSGAAPNSPFDAASCARAGTVTFVVHAAADAGPLLKALTGSSDSPEVNWLTLWNADGGTELDSPGTTMPTEGLDCASCEPFGSNASLSWGQFPDAGVTASWDPVVYLPGTCGGASACLGEQCLPAGHYQVRVCACPAGALSGYTCTSLVCTTAPFDYPGTTAVTATLP